MSHRLLVKDSVGERELLLIDSITVGRDPRCDISDGDAQLSRRHAEFSVSDRGVLVRDLNSRNGMLVNGRKMLEALLHPGDVVQVGGLAVTFLRAGAEPEAVSMPAPSPVGRRPAPAPLRSRRGAAPQPVLPFRVPAEDDDRTSLMSLDQAAAAAIASLPRAAAGTGDTGDTRDAGESSGPVVPLPPAPAPELVEKPRVPITGVAEPGWTARITWHVATLAIVSFLVGAVSALPWRAGPLGGAALTAAAVLLLPLVALLAALALGLFVAARVRRATLSALSALAAQVREAGRGETERVYDPLGTRPSADLAEAINQVLERAGRP